MSDFPPSLPLGLEAIVERIVPPEWTVAHFNAALPAILSTPAMIGLMESAAYQAVQDALPDGYITLGTRIEVDHLKSCPVGSVVQAWARLDEINGRFLYFAVEARHGDVLLGRGRVGRAIIDTKRFAAKLGTKVV